jgi:hypothetical protein
MSTLFILASCTKKRKLGLRVDINPLRDFRYTPSAHIVRLCVRYAPTAHDMFASQTRDLFAPTARVDINLRKLIYIISSSTEGRTYRIRAKREYIEPSASEAYRQTFSLAKKERGILKFPVEFKL